MQSRQENRRRVWPESEIPSSWCCVNVWRRRWHFRPKLRWQWLQENGFTSMWDDVRWRLRLRWAENVVGHFGHKNGRSPEWVRLCVTSADESLYILPHSSHISFPESLNFFCSSPGSNCPPTAVRPSALLSCSNFMLSVAGPPASSAVSRPMLTCLWRDWIYERNASSLLSQPSVLFITSATPFAQTGFKSQYSVKLSAFVDVWFPSSESLRFRLWLTRGRLQQQKSILTRSLVGIDQFPNLFICKAIDIIDVKYILQLVACNIFYVWYISQKMPKTGLVMVN